MYDAAVLGLGGMGSAAASHAVRLGLSVVGFEQYAPVHALGASHGRTRLIRKAYFEGEQYVPLLERAYALWEELERESSAKLFDRCGALFAGKPGTNLIQGTLSSAHIHGLPIECLNAGDLAARFPAFAAGPDETILFEPDGGVVFPEETVAVQIAQARRSGAHLHFNTRVERWENTAAGVRMHLNNGDAVEARALAICCGPWFGQVLKDLGVPVRIERNVQAWFDPSRAFEAGRLPAFALERGGRFFYGFPDYGDGIKCAFHHSGEFAESPESLERSVSTHEIESLREQLAAFVPEADGTFRHASVCMYALTPDEHFVIGPHPANGRVFIAGGFSGHGFKFVPVVGEIMAEYLATAKTRHDVTMFSPQRFR